jgi:hypothetical protein
VRRRARGQQRGRDDQECCPSSPHAEKITAFTDNGGDLGATVGREDAAATTRRTSRRRQCVHLGPADKFVAPTASSSPTGGSGGPASTGSDLGLLIAFALGCLGVGFLLNRRRTNGAHRVG